MRPLASENLVCPECKAALHGLGDGVACKSCHASFARLAGGYLNLMPPSSPVSIAADEAYLAEQINHGGARAGRWLTRQVHPQDKSALDVGCGTGSIVKSIAASCPDLDTWGIDLPDNLTGWIEAGVDPQRIVAGSAFDLPFDTGRFDIVWSLGVIEHIGEPAPAGERNADRVRYLSEMLRVTRPGGRVIILAPHKWFPIDPAHNFSTNSLSKLIYDRTNLGVHRTWGPFPLVSYGELRRLARDAGAGRIRPLKLEDYFSFARTGAGPLARVVPAARFYLDHLPAWLGATPFAPYLAVELTAPAAD
ncbi:class I SAM-dependent methyltransferase [Mycobacterium sp. BMJ-28]